MKRLKKKSWKLYETITDDRFDRHEAYTGAIREDSRNIILPLYPYPALIFCTVSAAFDPICQYNRISGIAMALSPTVVGRAVSNAISTKNFRSLPPPTTTYLRLPTPIDNRLHLLKWRALSSTLKWD